MRNIEELVSNDEAETKVEDEKKKRILSQQKEILLVVQQVLNAQVDVSEE